MPYYSWSGIDITGKILNGKQFARSVHDLDKDLFNKEIALLKAKEANYFNIYNHKPYINQIIAHMSILLKAGLKIHQALDIVYKNTKNKHLKILLNDIKTYIYEGQTLSQALEFHKGTFGLLTRSVIHAGEKSSNLNTALEELVYHNKVVEKFKKKLKSVLFMPIITLILFIIIMLGLFIFIIPKFDTFFNSIDKNMMNKSTKFVLYLSKYINSKNITYPISIILILIITIKLFKLKIFNYIQNKVLVKLPIASDFLFLIYQTKFLQKLRLLLSSGISLANALEIITKDAQDYEQEELQNILIRVKSGKSLSYALYQSKMFNTYELIALIEVGESSGDLVFSISQANKIYQNRIYSNLNKIIFLIQPLILVILGSLISGLIFAIYIPIFNLSSLIKL